MKKPSSLNIWLFLLIAFSTAKSYSQGVELAAKINTGKRTATGFVFNNDNGRLSVMTALHVVYDGTKFTINVENHSGLINLKVSSISISSDLAILIPSDSLEEEKLKASRIKIWEIPEETDWQSLRGRDVLYVGYGKDPASYDGHPGLIMPDKHFQPLANAVCNESSSLFAQRESPSLTDSILKISALGIKGQSGGPVCLDVIGDSGAHNFGKIIAVVSGGCAGKIWAIPISRKIIKEKFAVFTSTLKASTEYKRLFQVPIDFWYGFENSTPTDLESTKPFQDPTSFHLLIIKGKPRISNDNCEAALWEDLYESVSWHYEDGIEVRFVDNSDRVNSFDDIKSLTKNLGADLAIYGSDEFDCGQSKRLNESFVRYFSLKESRTVLFDRQKEKSFYFKTVRENSGAILADATTIIEFILFEKEYDMGLQLIPRLGMEYAEPHFRNALKYLKTLENKLGKNIPQEECLDCYRGRIYQFLSNPDSAKLYLNVAIKKNPSQGAAWWTLGNLFSEWNQVEAADSCLKIAYSLVSESYPRHPFLCKPCMAGVLLDRGRLYLQNHNYKIADSLFQKSLSIYRDLAQENHKTYNPLVANCLGVVGMLYSHLNNCQLSESFYLEALRINQNCFDIDSIEYLPDLAQTQNNLGVLYREQGHYRLATTYLKRALAGYQTLSRRNALEFMPILAISYTNLGRLYLNLQFPDSAEFYFLKANKIYIGLLEGKRQEYTEDFASTYHFLGDVYRMKQLFQKADSLFYLSQKLIVNKIGPDIIRTILDEAGMQNSLGVLYGDSAKKIKSELLFIKAEMLFLSSLSKLDSMKISYPTDFIPKTAGVLYNLGNLYRKWDKNEEADSTFKAGIEIWKLLSSRFPEIYLQNLASAQVHLAKYYYKSDRIEDAKVEYISAINSFKKFSSLSNCTLQYDLGRALVELGVIYREQENYLNADSVYKVALDVYTYILAEDSIKYLKDVVSILNDLSITRAILNHKAESGKYMNDAIHLSSKYLLTDPEDLSIELCKSYGNFLLKLLRQPNAPSEDSIKRALTICDSIVFLGKYVTIKKSDYNKVKNKAFEIKLFLGGYPYPELKLLFDARYLEEKIEKDTLFAEKSKTFSQIIETLIALIQLKPQEKKYQEMLLEYSGRSAYYLLFEQKFEESEKMAKKVLSEDKGSIWMKIILANSYLFQGKYSKAMKVYSKYKDGMDDQGNSYKETILLMMEQLENSGVTHPDVEKVRSFLLSN